MKKNYLILLLLSTIVKFSIGQTFHPPLDFRLLLSGTFGELRNNHFHAGIDIKTNETEGHPIYSIAEGYVSRIKVSTWGYGKAIYIIHPDGKTSVYAHLQKFNNKIDSIVKIEHYKKESFELNFYPNKNKIKIKKGEFIAFSGNSGSSAGAHLHFELRDTKSEHPINPLTLDFDINDDIPPTLKKLKIYTFGNTTIEDSTEDKIYNLKKKDNNYIIAEIPKIDGDFGLGIYT